MNWRDYLTLAVALPPIVLVMGLIALTLFRLMGWWSVGVAAWLVGVLALLVTEE